MKKKENGATAVGLPLMVGLLQEFTTNSLYLYEMFNV